MRAHAPLVKFRTMFGIKDTQEKRNHVKGDSARVLIIGKEEIFSVSLVELSRLFAGE
jgi:lipopolysaccharide/colanic/teichoic acid biosynthesis glycosyltransferase